MTRSEKQQARLEARRRIEAARKVAYYTNEHAKEVKRCQERTAWIQALMGSLPKGG